MANRQFSRLSLRWRVMLILFAVIVLPVELIVHSILARECYYLNVKNLQLMALTAVKMGAEYLPATPRVAVQVADSYVQSQGIAPAEIGFTEPSSDNNMLTIRLDRQIPRFVAVLAMGGLPARDIVVTASAWRQRAGHPFGTRILDLRAVQSSPHEAQDSRVFPPGLNWDSYIQRLSYMDVLPSARRRSRRAADSQSAQRRRAHVPEGPGALHQGAPPTPNSSYMISLSSSALKSLRAIFVEVLVDSDAMAISSEKLQGV